jgi:hypothetical protein
VSVLERMNEDDGTPPELLDALSRARRLEPDPADWQRCVTAVEKALLAAPSPAPSTLPTVGKVALAVVASGLVAGGVWFWSRSEPTRAHDAPPAGSVVAQLPPEAPAPSARDFGPPPAASNTPSRATRAPEPKVLSPEAPASATATEGPRVAPPGELELLEQARAAVSTQPATALQLIAQHRRLYPRSVMSQERELLEIEALLRSGNRAAAEQGARRFQQAYPRSLHHRRIDALLGKHEP